MSEGILGTRFTHLTFIILVSVLLCLGIRSVTSADPIEDSPAVSRTEPIEASNATLATDNENEPHSEPLEIPTINSADESLNDTASALDNQTALSTSPPSTKNNLSGINSFEEWKQQQLLADLNKKREAAEGRDIAASEASSSSQSKTPLPLTNLQQSTSATGSTKKGKRRKNFASGSCGAKILAHNPEAQHTSSVLSSSPDEYMLNPCNAKIWFAIELCESIRILNIEIANFELFSSVPKTFRVSASDRYPTKDWHRYHLGTFNASFNRTIQSFHTTESTTYLKYVKFELLDFHGHEHYCPLSVVRIHGSNVEEEIIIMEENTNPTDVTSLSKATGDENENDDDDANDLSNDQQVGGIIGSAILDLAKRVFRRQTIRGTPSTTVMPTTEASGLKTDCHRSILNGSISNHSMQSWRHGDLFKQCIAKFLRGHWSTFGTCSIYLSQMCWKSSYCCQCPSTLKQGRANVTLNLYVHVCGYYHLLVNQFVCKKEKVVRLNETLTSKLALVNTALPDLLGMNSTVEKPIASKTDEQNATVTGNVSMANLNASIMHGIQLQPIVNQTPAKNITRERAFVLEPVIVGGENNQSASQSNSSEPVKGTANVTEPTTTDTDPSADVVSTTAATLSNNEPFPSMISNPWLKGMLINTKSLPELFKIIEKLNFNLTLSNRYLQELSQHYVKKLDETQQTTDLLLQASKAADEQLKQYEEHLAQLQENFDELSHRLMKLEAWIPLILCILVGFFVCCLWTTCRLSQLRRHYQLLRDDQERKLIEQTENDEDDDLPVLYSGLKQRKSSTDSSDSAVSRPQRVPDLTPQAIIRENGLDKHCPSNNGPSPDPTRRLLSLSTVQTSCQ